MSGAIYPISKLIEGLLVEHAASEVDFVARVLGYRDSDKGLRRLREWTEKGEGAISVIRGIGWATERGPELERAIVATKAIKAQNAELAFRDRCQAEAATFNPFLTAVGERSIPSQICSFGLSGGHERWTLIQFPRQILDLSFDKQLEALRPRMLAYREEYGGWVPFFGVLKGFKLARLADYVSFDAEGNFLMTVNKPFRLGQSTVAFR